jgi:hypothetical protein
METIKFNKNEYYLAKNVYEAEPQSFAGCSKTVRNIIKVKNLTDKEYIYLRADSTKALVAASVDYPRAKLYLAKKWVHDNLIQFKKVKTEEDEQIESMKAPPLLELSDSEKFTDESGNILEVEIRGEREYNKCYFKVKDIENAFGINNISKTMMSKETKFDEKMHYQNFTGSTVKKLEISTSKKSEGNQKSMFLTYLGLTRLLFVSRSKNAEHFQKWAIEKLFTIQMGSLEQKEELVNKLMGVPCKNVKDVLKTSSSPVSCVYLFTLGTVATLRDVFKIPKTYADSSIVVKYGKTDDLERRSGENNSDYSAFKGVEVKLKCYSHVDSKHITDAENDVRDFIRVTNLDFAFDKFKELAIVPKDKMVSVEKKYSDVRKIYAGNMSEIINEKEKLMNEIEKKTLELENKNNTIEMNRQLYEKDLENKNLQIKLLTLQLSINDKTIPQSSVKIMSKPKPNNISKIDTESDESSDESSDVEPIKKKVIAKAPVTKIVEAKSKSSNNDKKTIVIKKK